MKKMLLIFTPLLGMSSFAFDNFINDQKNISQIQLVDDSNFYIDTSYTHTWTRTYITNQYSYNMTVDSSNTYYAGKWSKYSTSWNGFIRKYKYIGFTNNSFISLQYNNHTYEYSTRKNNFWNPTNRIKEYVSGKNTNIVFQINTGVKAVNEASLILEVWYTNDGEIYFKWNFALTGKDLKAKISIHLPQVKYYY